MAGAQGYQAPPRMRRRRRRRWPLITLIVIIVLLVVGDRAANAYTENQMASQIQSSLGLSGKPHVTIQGFPFLTQLAARDFRTVDVNASNETIKASSAGSGLLEIASLTATLHGMHIHGLNSATIDQFNASALITFTALGNVGGIPQGITLSADGPNTDPGQHQHRPAQRHGYRPGHQDRIQPDQRQGHPTSAGFRRTSSATWRTSASASRSSRPE